MKFSRCFFNTTSACAFIGGILIVVYWLLNFGFAQPGTLEEEIALQDHTMYTVAQWVHFAFLFFVLAAFWGVAAMKMEVAPGLVTTGFIFFLFDFIPSILVGAVQIFTFNYTWASGLATAQDGAVKTMLMTNMSGFYSLLPAVTFVTLVGFLVGALLFGMATWKGSGLEKAVGIFFFLMLIGDFLWAVGIYGSQQLLMDLRIRVVLLVGAVLLLLIGAWLWKGYAKEGE